MKVQFHPEFIENLKSVDVRVRKCFRKQIERFQKNHLDPHLDNHKVHGDYEGYHSIDVTNDYRAIYEELNENEDTLAYFFKLGTHNELYDTKIIKVKRK
jgi:addiction module RelE/StbE family toxin